jgi:hypothetical protein
VKRITKYVSEFIRNEESLTVLGELDSCWLFGQLTVMTSLSINIDTCVLFN